MSLYMCPKCGATGKIGKKKCDLCKGKKMVTEEVVRKRSGKPGRAEYKTSLDLRG